eukprot:COSAG01_NODE_975_length_12366_cov_20.561833_5_plen_80_part_00
MDMFAGIVRGLPAWPSLQAGRGPLTLRVPYSTIRTMHQPMHRAGHAPHSAHSHSSTHTHRHRTCSDSCVAVKGRQCAGL